MGEQVSRAEDVCPRERSAAIQGRGFGLLRCARNGEEDRFAKTVESGC